MSIQNGVVLITYPDSLGKNLNELSAILNAHLRKVVTGIHILPFFPSSADRGFAPLRYDEIDEKYGSWADLSSIADSYDLVVDFMINHISRQSFEFQDFLKRGEESPFADLFIKYKDFWPGGEPAKEDSDLIYKRKPRDPYIDIRHPDGTEQKIWCTFGEEQIDLNTSSAVTREYIKRNLLALAERASLIRLDAVGYVTKRVGTSCFFVEPDIWEVLSFTREILDGVGVDFLPEVHEHYSYQKKLEEKGYWVYDFALPMLVLYSLYSGRGGRLKAWLNICPRKQFTTLDTHDGIGIVDVVDLLTEEEIRETREMLYKKGANVKKKFSTTEYNNLDIYQINCTFYSALGDNDKAYLLARAIQFFTPGIPQVYYVGLLAGKNDIDLVEKTKLGRDINRHCYTNEEVEKNLKRDVVKALFALCVFRNEYDAFSGKLTVLDSSEETLHLRWTNGELQTELKAHLPTYKFSIEYIEGGESKFLRLDDVGG